MFLFATSFLPRIGSKEITRPEAVSGVCRIQEREHTAGQFYIAKSPTVRGGVFGDLIAKNISHIIKLQIPKKMSTITNKAPMTIPRISPTLATSNL